MDGMVIIVNCTPTIGLASLSLQFLNTRLGILKFMWVLRRKNDGIMPQRNAPFVHFCRTVRCLDFDGTFVVLGLLDPLEVCIFLQVV